MTRSVSSSVLINAPADKIFAVLSDARRHPDFDGSGSVKASMKAPDTLSMGAKFGMRMRIGVPYVITNEVVEFQQDTVIAWQHFGKHIWRYELTPEGVGTRVTESFDWGSSRSPAFIEKMKYPAKNAVSMEKTLVRLKALLEE